jgi:hypothetical protein
LKVSRAANRTVYYRCRFPPPPYFEYASLFNYTFFQQRRRWQVEIVRDKYGKPQGTIREIAGGQERLYDRTGRPVATYRPDTEYTYDNNGARIGSGNRLPGLAGNKPK